MTAQLYHSTRSMFSLLAITITTVLSITPTTHTKVIEHSVVATAGIDDAADRVQSITKIVNKLLIDKEICKQSEHHATARNILDKVSKNDYGSSYEAAEMLLAIVTLDGTITPPNRASYKNISTQEATKKILEYIELSLIERGKGLPQRCARPVIDMIQKYKVPLAIIALPCLIYGGKKFFEIYIARNVGLASAPANNKNNATKPAAEITPAAEIVDIFKQYIKPATAGITVWSVLCTKPVKTGVKRAEDLLYGTIAWLMDKPYRDSNPASSSKVGLTETPAPLAVKDYLRFTARALVYAEEVAKLHGLLPRALLFTGDRSLTVDLARGLAHEITKQLKYAGKDYGCKIAVIHASKLATASLKEEIEEIKSRNQSAIIVIEDIDWIQDASDEVRTQVITELINNTNKATAQHEQYMIIGTASARDTIDPILHKANLFAQAHTFDIALNSNEEVMAACIRRIEMLFGIRLTNPTVVAYMQSYLRHHSFAELVSIVHIAYTKSLPHFNEQQFNQESLLEALQSYTESPQVSS